jgi:hypothetical protein
MIKRKISKGNIEDYVGVVKEFIETYGGANQKESGLYGGLAKPELILASRKAENPIRIIDRTNDRVYYITINEVSNTYFDTDDVVYTMSDLAAKQSKEVCQRPSGIIEGDGATMNVHVKLYNDEDKMKMSNIITYAFKGDEDNIFIQLLSGIFIVHD